MLIRKRNKKNISTENIVVFAMLGALMFCSKFITDILPNINLLTTLTVTYTLVYRKKALIPIYIYVLLNGIFAGFAVWWIPYLYLWLVPWGATMLIPQGISDKKLTVICCLICSLNGLLFGVLYAPFQAICYGLSFDGMLAWIVAGFPFDVIHSVSNLFLGLLVVPLTKILRRVSNIKFRG